MFKGFSLKQIKPTFLKGETPIFRCFFKMNQISSCYRSSRPEVFCGKGVLRNFAKCTGKHLCQSLNPRPATSLKKRLWHSCFPANFV